VDVLSELKIDWGFEWEIFGEKDGFQIPNENNKE